MKHKAIYSQWPAVAVGLAAAAILAAPSVSQAQFRGGRDSGSSRGDSGSRRDSAPSRSDSPGRRDSSPPPSRSESPGRRDSGSSPYTSGGFGRRDQAPPSYRPDSGSRRDSSPAPFTRPDYGSRRDPSPSYRSDSFPRSGDSPIYRSQGWGNPRPSDTPLRRDSGSPGSFGRSDSSPRWNYTPRDGASTSPSRPSFNDRPGAGPSSQGSGRTYDWLNRNSGSPTRDPGRYTGRQGAGDTVNHGKDPVSGGSTNNPYRPTFGGQDGSIRPGFGGQNNPSRPSSGSFDRNRFDRPGGGSGSSFLYAPNGGSFHGGIGFRPSHEIVNPGIRQYFARDRVYYPSYSQPYCYYPYYSPSYSSINVVFSLYSPYYGVCPPYLYRDRCYYRRPSYVYIDVPIYVGDECRGYGDSDDYYLSDRRNDLDPDLQRAIDDLHDAFRFGKVEELVNLTDPNTKIAVFLKGKYDYTIDPNDYLDLTRDALRTIDTLEFNLYRVHPRGAGVWVVSGKHVYRDTDGRTRAVYVSFVLERDAGRWTLTQVGTAPDRIREP